MFWQFEYSGEDKDNDPIYAKAAARVLQLPEETVLRFLLNQRRHKVEIRYTAEDIFCPEPEPFGEKEFKLMWTISEKDFITMEFNPLKAAKNVYLLGGPQFQVALLSPHTLVFTFMCQEVPKEGWLGFFW